MTYYLSRMSGSDHVYDQLHRQNDEIRLVQITGTGPEGIRCAMSTVPLRVSPQYVALSYTWGGVDATCAITLDGQRFSVRKNLWRFLNQVTQIPSIRLERFWIDAICINQSDDHERTHQVGIMTRIYQRAYKVMAWLGPAYDNSDMAMHVLDRTNNSRIRLWSDLGIVGICERGYWTRLWVLQELVLAQDLILMCGRKQIKWEHFKTFMERIQSERFSPIPDEDKSTYECLLQSRAMSMIEQVRLARGWLLDQMYVSRHLVCSDLHDKVYGLLGIVSEGHKTLSPDYGLSIPALASVVLAGDPLVCQLNSLTQLKERCQLAAEIIGIDVDALMTAAYSSDKNSKRAIEEIAQCPLRHEDTRITLWWLAIYGTSTLRNVWLESFSRERIVEAFLSAIEGNNRSALRLLLTVPPQYGRHLVPKYGLLHEAVRHADVATMRLLLDRLSDFAVNYPNDQGQTPLSVALASSRWDIARLLLPRFSPNGHLNTLGDLFIHTLASKERSWGRSWQDQTSSLSTGAGDIEVTTAVCKLSLETAEAQIDQILDFLCCHTGFSSILVTAIEHRLHPLIGKLLARRDINVNFHTSFEAPGPLARHRCSPDAPVTFGQTTPLLKAIDAGEKWIVMALLKRKEVDVNIAYWQGRTPIMQAVANDQQDIVELLLARPDVRLDLKNAHGYTTLDLSIDNSSRKILLSLLADEHAVLGVHGIDRLIERLERQGFKFRLESFNDHLRAQYVAFLSQQRQPTSTRTKPGGRLLPSKQSRERPIIS